MLQTTQHKFSSGGMGGIPSSSVHW